jgi:hypothetical protein
MKKLFSSLLVFVFLAIPSQILAQDSNTKSRPLPKNPDFKPVTIVPNFTEENIKWEETFDTTVQPGDWIVIDNDGSGSAYSFEQQLNFTGGDVNPQAGQSFWFSNYTNANGSGLIDEWLISPQIPTIDAGDSLVFYAGSIGGSYPDSLKVLISTTDQNPASFTEIAYFLVTGPIGAWNRYAFDLTPFAGSQIYVAVNYYIVDGGPTGNNSDNVWVDHLIVTSAPSNTARVQVIHNSADVLAGSVDVYVNDALAIPDFAFRAATPFIDLPAGVTLNIGVAPGNSTSVNDTLKNFPVILDAGETYVVFANGVLTSGYAPNPDGRNTDFTLFVKPMAQEVGTGTGVDLFVLHGSTDAPTVDVKVRELGSATIVDDAAYGDITPYLTAPAQDITLDLYLGNGVNYVASFTAPLSGLGGGSAAVFASGFLDPSGNQNGEAFGLFAALANGTVVALPAASAPNTFFDDFESYTAGQLLAQQNPVDWTTWSNAPGGPEDALVSSTYAFSGANSVNILPNDDLVKPLGNLSTGKWYISFMYYVPATKSGYFNTMNGFTPNPFVWGMDVYFDAGGAGRIDTTGGGGAPATTVNFSYAVAQWNQAIVIVDLDT